MIHFIYTTRPDGYVVSHIRNKRDELVGTLTISQAEFNWLQKSCGENIKFVPEVWEEIRQNKPIENSLTTGK